MLEFVRRYSVPLFLITLCVVLFVGFVFIACTNKEKLQASFLTEVCGSVG